MCSNTSSLVFLTTVLELPLAMMLTTVVLLVIDRRLPGERKRGGRAGGGGGGGEEAPWVAGSLSNGRCPPGVGEVRRRVSTCRYSGRPIFVRVLALFPFLPFPAMLPSLYLEFRIYLSGLRKCPGLRETPSRLGLHNNALGLRETPSQLSLHNNALSLPVSS